MNTTAVSIIIQKHSDKWMKISGVEGVGEGLHQEKPCIVIFASVPADDLKIRIPETIDGYPVVIHESGTFATRL